MQQFFLGGRYPSADDVSIIYDALEKTNAAQSAVSLQQIEETIGDGLSKTKPRVRLNLLKDEKIVRERGGAKFELLKPNTGGDRIKRLSETYVERGMSDREKFEQMMLYAQSASCRWQTLSKYFTDAVVTGGEEIEKCETCDNCVRPVSERFDVQIPPDKLKKAEQE